MTLKRVERGIYVRDGGVLYVLYKDERGETVWKSTKQKSIKAARTILDKCKTEVAMSIALPNRKFESVKFSELLDDWWEREGRGKAGQWEYLKPRIEAQFSRLKARDITSDMIEDWLKSLRKDDGSDMSASSRNHHRTILNRCFNFAIGRLKYDLNPVRPVHQFREPAGRDRFPTAEEIRAVLAKLAEDPETLCAVIVLSTTTLRKGELLQRQWSEMRLDGPVPHIYIPKTKNGHEKKVPIPAVAARLLLALPSRGSEYVFPSRPTARWPSPAKPHRWDIGKEFRAACESAGVKNLRVHDLRHMGVSILTEQGVSPEIIRKISGHRGRELDRYQHLSEDLKRGTVEVIADQLFGQKDGETVH